MNEGVAEASERMLKGAGAFAHETPYAVGKHYRQINSGPDVYLVRVPFLNISTSETNCYLICDGGECLAVDTGAPLCSMRPSTSSASISRACRFS